MRLLSFTSFWISFWISTAAFAEEVLGVTTLAFFDSGRQRPIVVEVLYPAAKGSIARNSTDLWVIPRLARDAPVSPRLKAPLILFSHGDGGSRTDSIWLMAALAKAGYIVASVDHYGNTWYLHLPQESLERWHRPQDISYVIPELLKNQRFKPHLQPEKIGFAGFSLGGLTGIWLAGGTANLFQKPIVGQSSFVELDNEADQALIDRIDYSNAKKNYFDSSIKAAFLMAPAYGNAFDESGLKNIKTPLHIVAGAADQVLPIESHAKKFKQLIPNSQLTILPGKVGHFVFLNEATTDGKKKLRHELVQDGAGVNRRSSHGDIATLAIQFFNQHLR